MCGRYVLAFDCEHYLGNVQVGADIYNFNVAPTNTVPVLVDHMVSPTLFDSAGGGAFPNTELYEREIHPARWGLLPSWAKDASYSARAFNARSETVFEKPTFRDAAVNGHCAVPVTGYYEWKTETAGSGKTQKTPYFIYREDGAPIYFAGLYEWWQITEVEAQKPGSIYAHQAGQWVLTCSIMTMDAPDEFAVADIAAAGLDEKTPFALSQLHNRLPIPLTFTGTEDDGLTCWLRSGQIAGAEGTRSRGASTVNAREALAEILGQAYKQTASWSLHPVSSAVGNVRNNGSQLIEPVEDLLSGLF